MATRAIPKSETEMKESEWSESRTPPNGWCFRQPEFGSWTVQNPISKTLNQAVLEVIAARKQNPALTAKFQLSTNYEVVKSEVIRFNRKRLGLPEEATPAPFLESPSRLLRGVGDAAVNLKRAAQGTAVVLDWLRSGGAPVAQEIADKRASICVECPKNVEATAWYVQAPAQLIKETLEARKDLKLETPYGERLKSCDVCRCVLPLKVWVPLEHIVSRTKPEVMAEFPAQCWIPLRQ